MRPTKSPLCPRGDGFIKKKSSNLSLHTYVLVLLTTRNLRYMTKLRNRVASSDPFSHVKHLVSGVYLFAPHLNSMGGVLTN